MVVIGGLGSIWGVVLGAILLSELNTYLLPRVLYDVPSKVGLDFDLSAIASGIYGFLLVVVMLLRPEGLLPEGRHRVALRLSAARRPVDERVPNRYGESPT
jgi:branched-chain amino acid transport system permease protein